LFPNKSLEGFKEFKTDKEEINIDILVDNLLIKKTKNNEFFSPKKSNNVKIIKDFFKKKTTKRVLTGFILILLIFALWASSITSLYGDINSDIIVSLEPRAVYNGDTIQINVSVPNYYNISSLTADMGGKDNVDLFLLDNSSDYHIWIGNWVVQNMSPGYHIARIFGKDIENISYSLNVEWKVLTVEEDDFNYSSNKNNPTNVTINETEIPENIDNENNTYSVNDSINETNFDIIDDIYDNVTEPNISDEEELSAVVKPDDFSKAFNKFELPKNSFGPLSLKIINTDYFWDYFDKNSNWFLEVFDSEKGIWINIKDSLKVDKNRSENSQFEKISLTFSAPINGDYRLTFNINKPLKFYVDKSNQFVYELVYPIGDNDEYSTYFDFSDIAKLPRVIIDHGIKNINGYEFFWFSVQKNNIAAGTNIVLDPTFGNTATSTSTTVIRNYIKGGYFQMGSNTGYGTSITAYLYNTGGSKNAKCALYNSSKILVADSMTEEKTISTGWNTFNFNTTKPVLTANAWYYIVIWCYDGSGQGDLYYATSGGSGVFSDNETYVAGSYSGFPSPFEGSTVDADGLASIYCTYYETTPPTPNPMTWATEPYETSSSSITMVATTASDNTPPISYYFNETTGNSGGTDSAWQASTTYTDSGLSENTQYGYEVKAIDSNSTPNEGSYSTPISYDYTDVDPPTDNELTFLIGTTWINASVAQPPNPSSGSTGSYFNWVTGGAANSGWQTGVYYHNRTGLSENTQYGSQVRYRNGDADASAYNPTEKTNYTYCEPPTDGEFTIDDHSNSWINMSVAQPTNPTTGSTAAYFECVTGGASSSGWVTNSASGRYYYNATGLNSSTTYGFRVKYRNAEGIETTYTIEKQQFTNSKPTIEPITPKNGSTNENLQPICQIWANDTDGNTLTIDWYENTTGSWILRQTNTSVSANSTLNWTFTQANAYGTTYWWKVSVNDSIDNVTFLYYFTTESLSTSVDSITPYVISTSPFTITATNSTPVDNVTLYYRWSDDNSSWGHSGETTYDTPTIDNTASRTEIANTNSISWTHTVSSGLSNSILIVGVNVEDEDAGDNFYVTSADFNGDALSRAVRVAADEGTADISEIWYLLSPDAGSYTVRVNFSIIVNGALGGSASFSNVKQSAPYHTNTTIDTGSPTDLATSVNTQVANSLMIAVATDGQGTFVYSYGSGQTQIYDIAGSSHEGAGSRKLSTIAGSSTMYTNLSGASNRMSQVVAAWTPSSVTWGNGTNWAEWSNSSNPDISSPWSWGFDFPNGTGYYEFYSIGKKSGSTDESAPVSADTICVYNRPPTITNEGPTNESIDIQVLPQMNITINDPDGDPMAITWYSNSSGSWQVFGTNISVSNGTYHQINNNFSNYFTIYWWNVTVSDGINTNTSGTFHFTTTIVLPTIYTNTTTGIEETNATLNGYLQNNGGNETTCGFRYGTSSGSYTENFTKNIYLSNTEFSNNNGSLSPGQIYFYQAWATNIKGFANGSEETFLTKPQAPTNLTAQKNSSSIIYLTWTIGTGANKTYIETKSTPNWDLGEGTIIYNDSGTNYEHTVTAGAKYYYQAWSYTNWTYDSTTLYQWSDENASAFNSTNIPPTITNEVPVNESTDISLTPDISITVNDIEGATMMITWYSNSSGTWQIFGINNSVGNGTYYQTNSNFTSPGNTYWWNVSVYDGVDINNSGIFHFTTSYQPTISNPGPSNNSVAQYTTPICNITVSDVDGGTVTVRFYENTTGSWILQQTNISIDVTNPANVIWSSYNNATQDYTTYWWMVNVSDGKGCYAEEIYHFTTANTSIEITPSAWDQGVLIVGSSNETTGFYFNLTNNGDVPLYIQIKASNATNATTGAKWALNATPSYDNFTLQYNKSGGGTWTAINLTYDLFTSYLDIGSWQTFDIKLIMATLSSTGNPLSMDLTFRSIKV